MSVNSRFCIAAAAALVFSIAGDGLSFKAGKNHFAFFPSQAIGKDEISYDNKKFSMIDADGDIEVSLRIAELIEELF